jgi:hypothetical protein
LDDEGEANFGRKYIISKLINNSCVSKIGDKGFWVDDGTKAHAVKLLDNDKFDCQCGVTKMCLHKSAVQ